MFAEEEFVYFTFEYLRGKFLVLITPQLFIFYCKGRWIGLNMT
jgi:hypothetical protein